MTDLDRLNRDQLPELPRRLAGILDEWLHRVHGVHSSAHGVGLLLDLLAEADLRVETGSAPKWEFDIRITDDGKLAVRHAASRTVAVLPIPPDIAALWTWKTNMAKARSWLASAGSE